MDGMAAAWRTGRCPEPQLKYRCRNCEFRLGNGRQKDDGFHACWGKLAEPDPHLFSLYQLYSVKRPDNRQALLADQKIEQGQTSLYDIEESELSGEHQHRQRIQLECQRSGEEWIDPKLAERIDRLSTPVAFVDFETILMTMPWYAGCRPGQVLPFQFSAHILHRNGQVQHREWLNLRDEVPTLEFIRQLKSALGDVPSIMVYTDYEVRILKEALAFPVREGTAAMRAYREMIRGRGAECATTKEALANMLREYVTLDTISQFIIFEHWRSRLLGKQNSRKMVNRDTT